MGNNRELLERIKANAKAMLSKKRYIHSVGVMKKAEELARVYNIDEEKAKLLGMAHDIAKEMQKEEIFEYIKKYHISIDEYEEKNMSLLHGKIGAYFCKEKYEFTEDMQKAVEYHTTGHPEMDDLAKIIFIADKIEEGRKHVNFSEVLEKQGEGLNSLLLYVLDHSIIHVIEKKKTMHPATILTRNYFLEIEKRKNRQNV